MTVTEDRAGSESEPSEMDFQQMYEQSLKELKEGELVRGTVVQVTKDSVVVDIGYKSEGQVPLREFLDHDGNTTVTAGQEIQVFLEKWEDDQGYVVLSKSKADNMKVWDELGEACEKSTSVAGTIVKRVKGGFHVDISGIIAFLPNSHVDLKPVRQPDRLLGQGFDFTVIKLNKRKNNVIVSRRALLEKERKAMRDITLEKLHEGAVVEGVVKNITDYGAFLDLGGIDGLLHLTDMSWGKVNHPSQILKTDDTVSVKILKFDKEENKISLGLKQTKPNPWEEAEGKYQAGTKVSGKVVNITDYGAFVELEEGLEGLVHISEMSWTKLRHPSQKVKVGDGVDVVVLDLDPPNKRISLGMKQVESNPWDDLESRYPVGSKVKGVVRNITDFGAFVGVEDGIDGLVHISDISWKKIKHPSEIFKKGQEIEAVVVNIDKKAQRFSLSTKTLGKNPWEDVEENYKPGMIVEGVVTGVADFGAFVELEEGLEGLVHISEISRGKQKGVPLERGDTLEVEILNVDPSDKKIGLSIRKHISSAAGPEAESTDKKAEGTAPQPTGETEPSVDETPEASTGASSDDSTPESPESNGDDAGEPSEAETPEATPDESSVDSQGASQSEDAPPEPSPETPDTPEKKPGSPDTDDTDGDG